MFDEDGRYQSNQDFILENDAVSPYFQKLINTTRSAEELSSMIEAKKLDKQSSMEGFQDIQIVNRKDLYDPDSFGYYDAQGRRHEGRLTTVNEYDAIDNQRARERSPYKSRLQPEAVARLTGISLDELRANPAHSAFNHVKAYQDVENFRFLTEKDYKFSPYDPNKDYDTTTPLDKPINLKAKVVGRDADGRELIQVINPNTGRDIAFDASNNPYLNASFDYYKSIDTAKNREKQIDYQVKHGDYLKNLADALDTDGKIGESIDIAQSTAYQSAARLLQYGPDWLVDKEKWAKIANAETGQALADAWAGVKTSTRREFAQDMLDGSDKWQEGDYIGAIMKWGSRLPEVFAESATQMGMMMGGAAIGSALGGPMAGILAGGALAATDSTLMANEDYKANNGGKSMSASELATNWAGNLALLIPEQLIMGMNIPKLLPKQLRTAVTQAYKDGPIAARLKTTASSTIFEGVQEGAQDTFNEYMSQNQENKKSLGEILRSPEITQSIVVGGLMGGALSGAGNIATAPFALRADRISRQQHEAYVESNNKLTVAGTQADTELSNKIVEEVRNTTTPDLSNPASVRDKLVELTNTITSNPDINRAAVNQIREKRLKILADALNKQSSKEDRAAFFKALGMTREEILLEKLHFSDVNAKREYLKNGKELSDKGKELAKEEYLEFADKLGVDRKTALKLMEEVSYDIKFGEGGYDTYIKGIEAIDAELSTSQNLPASTVNKRLREKANMLHGVRRLLDNQINKLEDFVLNAEDIASGVAVDKKFNFRKDPNGQGFFMKGSDLANNSYNSNRGVHRVVAGIVKEARELQEYVNSLPEDVKKNLYANDEYKLSSLSDIDTLEQRFIAASNTAGNRGITEATERNKKKGIDVTTMPSGVAMARLERLIGKPANNQVQIQFTNDLRSISQEQVDALHKYIDKSNRTPEAKAELHEKLNEIREVDNTTVQQEATTRAETRDKVISNAQSILDKYKDTKQFDNLSADELVNVYHEVHGALNEVANHHDKEASKLKSSIQQLTNTIVDIGRDKRKKENAVANEKAVAQATLPTTSAIGADISATNTTSVENIPTPTDNVAAPASTTSEVTAEKTTQAPQTTNEDTKTSDTTPAESSTESKPRYSGTPTEVAVQAMSKYTDVAIGDILSVADVKAAMEEMREAKKAVGSYNRTKEAKEARAAINEIYDKLKKQVAVAKEQEKANALILPSARAKAKTKAKAEAAPATVKPISTEKQTETTQQGNTDKPITSFKGTYLSNFHTLQNPVVYEGMSYPSVEHAYQAAKTANLEERKRFTDPNMTAADARKAGRKVTLRPDFDANKLSLMKQLVLDKFKNNPDLAKQLLATNTANLIEGNTWKDTFWGVDSKTGKGENNLGKILMEVREELRNPASTTKATTAQTTTGVTDSSQSARPYSKVLGTKESPIQVFSDGSDIKGTGKIGYGAVFEHNGKEYSISGTNETTVDAVAKDLRQVFPNAEYSNPTMEMLALAASLETIANLNVGEHVQINQDYKGAVNYGELWNHSEGSSQRDAKPWKAKKPYIQFLVDRAVKAIKTIEANGGSVSIRWVKGHSGDRMNDSADRHAKSRDAYNTFTEAYTADTATTTIEATHSEDTATSTEVEPTVVTQALDEFVEDDLTVTEDVTESEQALEEKLDKASDNITDKFAITSVLRNQGKGQSATLTGYGRKYNLANEVRISKYAGSNIAVNGEYAPLEQVKQFAQSLLFNINDIKDSQGRDIQSPLAYLMGYGAEKVKTTRDKLVEVWERYGDRHSQEGDKAKAEAEALHNQAMGLLASSPHLRLMYNIVPTHTKNKYGKDEVAFEANDIVLATIDYSVREFLSQSNLREILNPTTDYEICSLFGLDEEKLYPNEKMQLREFVQEYGVPKTVLADRVGTVITNNLGLQANPDGTYGEFERIRAGLGMFAVRYIAKMGFLDEKIFNPKEWNEAHAGAAEHVVKYTISAVRLTKKKTKAVSDNFKNVLKPAYHRITNDKSGPRYYKSKLPHDLQRRHVSHYGKVPAYTKGTMDKLWNTPYELNMEGIDFIRKHASQIAKRLGYVDSQKALNNMSKGDRLSAEGKNASIVSEMGNLLAEQRRQDSYVVAEGKFRPIYFNWFMSKNDRLFIDSNTLNPQSKKNLQRFMCQPKETYREFDWNNEDHKQAEYFAFCQAFDLLKNDNLTIQNIGEAIDKMELSDVRQMLEDFGNMSEEEFSDAYTKKINELAGTELVDELGVENLGQCIVVLQHIIKRKENNNQKFKTWLAVENDSTTSGYFIRFLQFPFKNILEEYGEKVGIIQDGSQFGNTEIHEMKAAKGFLDIYKTMAKNMVVDLDKILESNDKKASPEYYDDYFAESETKRDYGKYEALAYNFNNMLDALPLATKDANGDWKVTSALRAIMKSPTMVFGYTAGEKSISAKLSEEISGEFVSSYMSIMAEKGKTSEEKFKNYLKNNNITKEDKIKKLQAHMNTMEQVEKLMYKNKYKTLVDALKNQFTSEIKLKVGNITLTVDNYFNQTLAPIYGKAVWDSMSSSFALYEAINDSLNHMASITYDFFNQYTQNQLRHASNFEGRVSIKAYNKILQDSIDKAFILKPVFADSLEEGMPLMSIEKQRANVNRVSDPHIQNGRLIQSSTNANVRSFSNPRKAGAVLPIHSLDASVMSMLLQHMPNVIPVHDAIVMSALDNKQATQLYNKLSYALAKDYSMYTQLSTRFLEIMEAYAKRYPKIMEGSPVDSFNRFINIMPDINYSDTGVELFPVEDAKLNHMNLKDFMEKVRSYSIAVEKAREAFFASSNPVEITNMDGIKGSSVKVDGSISLPAQEFKRMRDKYAHYSSPLGYQPNAQLATILQEANTSVEGRIQLIDTLDNLAEQLGNRTATSEYKEHVKELLEKSAGIDDLKGLIVSYTTDNSYASGKVVSKPDSNTYEVTIGFDAHTDTQLDPMTKLSVYSDKSPVEIYAHEVVHAITELAMKAGSVFGIKKEMNQVLEIYKAAKEVTTWQDFMPDNYDKNLQAELEKYAKDTYDYIFNNPNTKDMEGPHEFLAYGLTNPKLMAVLKKHKIKDKYASNQNLSLLDKVIKVGKALLDVVFGREKFGTAFSLATEIMKGNIPLRQQQSLYAELDKTYARIAQANKKASIRFFGVPLRATETLFNLLGTIRLKGNNLISPILQRLFVTGLDERATKKGNPFVFHMKLSGTMFDNLKILSDAVLFSPFSKNRREFIVNTLLPQILHQSQQGILMTVLRDMTEPDMQSSRLEVFSALTRMTDQASKALEYSVYADLTDRFGRELEQVEEASLTTAGLQTDLSCLFEGTLDNSNIDHIQKLLTDKQYREQEIQQLEKVLQKSPEYKWIRNQITGLAIFMTKKIGNEAQNLNAHNIASGMMSGKKLIPTPEIVKAIDQLATLQALELNELEYPGANKIFANLPKAGLENFLLTHKKFVEETEQGTEIRLVDGTTKVVPTLNSVHRIKGYFKQLFDTSYDIKIDRIDNGSALAQEGYRLVRDLGVNGVTDNQFGLYRRTLATPNRRDGSTIILEAVHADGTALRDTAYSMTKELAQRKPNIDLNLEANAVWETYKTKAGNRSAKLNKIMHRKLLSADDILKMSSGYLPIINEAGKITDYRITMSNKNRVQDLGLSLHGRTILSKMYASKYTAANASVRNKALLQWLVDDMNNHMKGPYKSVDGKHDGVRYIRLEKDSRNQFVKDSWKLLPREFKQYTINNDLYVREDWVQNLFGVPAISIAQSKVLNHRFVPRIMKRATAIAEYILKTITYMAKQNIVLRVPAVLISNIASNLMVSIANGANPARVTRLTLVNAKAIRDYVDTRKALNRMEFRKKLGTATAQEITSINDYKMKLQNNIVHPLMQKGMYQAITEDIRGEELETIGKVQKFIRDSKVMRKIPKWVKTTANQLYLGEGTLFYEFMRQATQYSDFAARATEYQLQMEKAPARLVKNPQTGKYEVSDEYKAYEENLTFNLWNTFINYDKPQSALFQYLNDIGLMMFTKFALRIQSVIRKGIIENPMGAAMSLLGQSLFVDVEDIYEQNLFNKNWKALLYSPWDNLVNVAVPIPAQFAIGMR